MYRISALAATSSIHPALYAVSVRTVGISPRTSFSTVRYLPAVVLQVWDSASSRLFADFHRSTHIASVVHGKARRTFVLRALFTLAAIYSRGTCRPTTIDVLMFHFRVRNGTGWDHQAMTTRLRFVRCFFLLQPLARVVMFACSGALCSVVAACCFLCLRLCFQQADIRVARGFISFLCVCLTQGHQAFYQRLVTEGLIEVYWMLVALGSIHYCNYTCALSTWSSSTLL